MRAVHRRRRRGSSFSSDAAPAAQHQRGHPNGGKQTVLFLNERGLYLARELWVEYGRARGLGFQRLWCEEDKKKAGRVGPWIYGRDLGWVRHRLAFARSLKTGQPAEVGFVQLSSFFYSFP